MDKQVYWLYNSFGFYHPVSLAGKRATKFAEKHNQEKGGHWELHTKEQYDAWYESKGRHLEWLRDN